MGVEESLRISEEKGLFLACSGVPRCSPGPPEKGGRGRKRAISRKGGHPPLKRHLSAPGKWGRPRRGSSSFNQIPWNPVKVRLNSGCSPVEIP